MSADDARLNGDKVSRPCVKFIRSSRRAGPEGQNRVRFDSRSDAARTVRTRSDHAGFEYDGGSTIILGPDGDVRYTIIKSVVGAERLERRLLFLQSEAGSRYWSFGSGQYVAHRQLSKLLHDKQAAPLSSCDTVHPDAEF